MERYAQLVKQFDFEQYELLAFHTMGFFKYDNLKIDNPLKDTEPMDKSRLAQLQKYLNRILKEENKI